MLQTMNLSRFRTGFALFALALLAVPLIAMQFSTQVAWGPGDFLVIGGMLLALGAGLELAIRSASTRTGRIVGIGIAIAVFLAVWAELAVGIFD